MGLTLNLEEDGTVELDHIDIDIHTDAIEFSVDGEITNLSSELLSEYVGQQVHPVEITFETE